MTLCASPCRPLRRSDGEATAAVRLKVPRTAGIRGFAPVFPLNVQCNEDPRRTRGVVSLTRDAPRLFGIAQRPASLCAFYCTCDSRRQLKTPDCCFRLGRSIMHEPSILGEILPQRVALARAFHLIDCLHSCCLSCNLFALKSVNRSLLCKN